MAKDARKRQDPYITAIWVLLAVVVLILFAVAFRYQMFQATDEIEPRTQSSAMAEIKEVAENQNEYIRRDAYLVGMSKISSADENERASGMRIIMTADRARATPIITELLNDPSAKIRLEAVRLLGEYRVSNSGSYLIGHLADRDASVRAAAAAQIGKFQSEPGLMMRLGPILRDRNPEIVKTALSVWKALFPQNRREGVRNLWPLFSSRDPEIVTAALGASVSLLDKDETESFRSALDKIKARWPMGQQTLLVNQLYLRHGFITAEQEQAEREKIQKK